MKGTITQIIGPIIAIRFEGSVPALQNALTDINGIVAGIYYAVVGLGWVLPAMPIISWMSKPDKAKA